MKRHLIIAIIVSFAISPAMAGTYTDALQTCFAENTTGKDRKEMARWVFIGMAAHPEIKRLSNASDNDREQADRNLANLFTRLLTETCRAEAKAATKYEGEQAFKAAFGSLGQLAMQEIMTDQGVTNSMSAFARYLDKKKLSEALGGE
ncbi:MAG: hypothetical protein EPO06_07410 [Burkholderiaceae bacterium]|nr:MAG: hypothetical protein EPO06_07410 [Burkholderiaceae bacterium]